MAGTETRYRLVRYRGVWAAAWSRDRRTYRQSLRTRDADEARRRFADFLRATERTGETVGEIMAAYLAEKDHSIAAPQRLRDAWRQMERTFGHLRPDQVTRALCRTYVADRRKRGRGDGTIAKELRTLRAGLRWQDPQTPARFAIPSPPPPKDRALTREEYRRLLDGCAAPHVRLFVVLALATAGRAQAILGLTWNRVDFKAGLIRLDDGTAGKGRATVPMTETARRSLSAARRAAISDFVVEYAGDRVKSVRRAFERACGRAGLEGVTPHVLRHTAAVWMAEAGVPMSEIAQYLGHRDSRTTERIYARYSPGYLRGAARALEV